MNRSNTIRNANAMTGMNEYWMNALNHDQNSQSSFGTMKNGTKIGPTSAQTALAMSPNATTAREITFASVTTISRSQYRRLARIDHASGWMKCCQRSSRCSKLSSSDRASRMLAKVCAWSVIRWLNDTPNPGIGDA